MRIAGCGAIRRTLGDEKDSRGSQRGQLHSMKLARFVWAFVSVQCVSEVMLEDYRLIGDCDQ
jgi:hypothetical protein